LVGRDSNLKKEVEEYPIGTGFGNIQLNGGLFHTEQWWGGISQAMIYNVEQLL
jgi:hypothetical protein